ncbi:MAG: HD-GYP domain-containing protein [Calditrichaeota bacterium]|nr:HD-GYP domain-containing protein [Calditrichota bacterium]MCB9366443.1 HD-GYP domain-containing protein [Calditrichota bacterium]
MEQNTIHSPILLAASSLSAAEWAALQTLLIALKLRDEATYQHSLRVADLARRISARFGLSGTEQQDVLLAGLLHDIGKLAVPDQVLNKQSKLTRSERQEIARHPTLSSEILLPFGKFDKVRAIILQHHERYDGTGYPSGRRGDEILIESSILAVVDAFDAVCHERPYRLPLTSEEALGWIESESGRQFRPAAVHALVEEFETADALESRVPEPAKVLDRWDSLLPFKVSS